MLDKILVKEVIAPIIIVAASIIIYLICNRIIKKIFKLKIKRVNEAKQKTIVSLVNNIIKYFIAAIALMMILEIYGIDTTSLVASLGVIGLVAGLALQDILKDFIVGISVVFEDQYSIGDIVTIGGFKGEIVQLGLRTTRLRAYTGETKIIANRNITELINHTLAANIMLVDVSVSYESDIKKAKELLSSVCDELSEKYKLTKRAECLGIETLADSAIIFRIAIPANYSEKYNLARIFNEEIKMVFDKNNITIPYPQMVIHDGKRI